MEEGTVKFSRINENTEERRSLDVLPDELILKIFSLLPMFDESLATSFISKRWEDSQKALVPDVTLDDERLVLLTSFVYPSLLSNDPQALERLHLKLSRKYSASDFNFLVQVAVNRSLRKLVIDLCRGTLELPICLSTCTTLKSLILSEVSINVIPRGFCMPSLKSLHLFVVTFSGNESVATLLRTCPDLEYLVLNQTTVDSTWVRSSSLKRVLFLSVGQWEESNITSLLRICPVLEYMVVDQTKCYNSIFRVAPSTLLLKSLKSLHLFSVRFYSGESVERLLGSCKALEDLVIIRATYKDVKIFNINVPTLKSLSIENSRGKRAYVKESHGFVIKAPALETLNFKDTSSNFLIFEYMPEVTKASIEAICDQSEKFIGSLTSVQHLSLCCVTSVSETPYPKGSFFFFLEHLELCTCSAGWANLLACILNDAPRLQSLKLKSKHSGVHYKYPMKLWIEPTVVPECLSKHLENLEWREYEGTEEERKVAAYILANATCLHTVTFSGCRGNYTELKEMQRASETCQFVFE
ncbi:unnamed protein product [Thlaspi arvense]|uniref:F-box domain-containing protein n=1 Tax=Thlaspi arvense TaxID=13288 RepID=A0AAU9SRM4_THLAR|nr:unnamed protein product [Thlaspi arvense]